MVRDTLKHAFCRRERLIYPFLLAVWTIFFATAAGAQENPYPAWLRAIGVDAAHAMGYTGAGVMVGVIDDGIQMNHPLLAANVSPESITYISDQPGANYTPGCNPVGLDRHGVAVAGCVVGTGAATTIGSTVYNNTLAYNAGLTGIRMNFFASIQFDSIAAAFRYNNDQIALKNCSWGMGTCYSGFSSSVIDAMYDTVAANTTLVFSSGNARVGTGNGTVKDANKNALQSAQQTITVAALNNAGTAHASFSSYGTCVFVSAPGEGIYTTDRTGPDGYTSGNYHSFSGTSAAAPVAVGAMALAVEALADNERDITMSTRLMKHLLVQTSDVVHLEASGDIAAWHQNAAGHWFSPTYGFGRINAGALAEAAVETRDVTHQTAITAQWDADAGALVFVSGAGAQSYVRATKDTLPFSLGGSSQNPFSLMETHAASSVVLSHFDDPVVSGEMSGGVTISPLASGTLVLESSMMFSPAFFSANGVQIQNLEEVVLTLGVTAENLNDMQIEMESPGGTVSTLAFADSTIYTGSGDLFWSFTSNEFWGENPVGEWKLRVYDTQGLVDVLPQEDWIFTSFYMGEIRLSDIDILTPEPATWVLLILSLGMVAVLKKYQPRA